MGNWFESWFNSPYYHMLYDRRNEDEAAHFLGNLLVKLNFSEGLKVIDLACGKGRHSKVLADLGMTVLGFDLSEHSISEAKKLENERLKFAVHDMRKPLSINNCDVVFNLFTSFGYFENNDDNLCVLQNIHDVLKGDGYLVIDFMNAELVIKNLVPNEVIIKREIEFEISRNVSNKHIIKEIKFNDCGKNFFFKESVQALFLSDFEKLFEATKFKLTHVFGDYNLSTFAANSSPRLIMVCRKF